LFVLLLDLVLAVDPPKLAALHPAGMAIGSGLTVEAIGTTAWPVKGLEQFAAIRIEALPDKGKLKINAAADAAPGPVLIRLYNESGCSEARIFVLGRNPEVLEAPKNDRSRIRPSHSQPSRHRQRDIWSIAMTPITSVFLLNRGES